MGDAIREFIHDNKLEEKIYEVKIIEDWKKIMGHNIAAYTQSLALKSGKLTVYLNSSVLRKELQMNRQKMVIIINSYFGQSVVKDIILK